MVSDAFSLADAEEIKYETALDLTKFLTMENNFNVWDTASIAFSTLLARLPESENLKVVFRGEISSRCNRCNILMHEIFPVMVGLCEEADRSYCFKRLMGCISI